jgi:uracil-DNA glycosylase family 4
VGAEPRTLGELDAAIAECARCPRLVSWREQVAVDKRAAYANESYWGRPVPGFGSTAPTIWIVGLAPAAHGANRTGRMFTGDRSGDWLFASLHRVGLAALPTSTAREDGQRLEHVLITAAVHCAPPGNKPTREEFANCATWLADELSIVFPSVRVVVALGGLAWNATLAAVRAAGGSVPRPKPVFGHAVETQVDIDGRRLAILGCYHPSQQNTFTGRLTEPMLDEVLQRAGALSLDRPL